MAAFILVERELPGGRDAAASRSSNGGSRRPRVVTFVENGERVQVPGTTPAISKPWNMDPGGGAAVAIAERDGRPLLRYAAEDGTEAELLARPVPLAQHNPGDEILLKVSEHDAAGRPIYKLAVVRID